MGNSKFKHILHANKQLEERHLQEQFLKKVGQNIAGAKAKVGTYAKNVGSVFNKGEALNAEVQANWAKMQYRAKDMINQVAGLKEFLVTLNAQLNPENFTNPQAKKQIEVIKQTLDNFDKTADIFDKYLTSLSKQDINQMVQPGESEVVGKVIKAPDTY